MQFVFENQGGSWFWLRNEKEIITWTLCAKQLNVFPREIIEKIADYLYDATYMHSACQDCMKNAQWLPVIPKNQRGGLRSMEFECNVKADDCSHPTPIKFPLNSVSYLSYSILK